MLRLLRADGSEALVKTLHVRPRIYGTQRLTVPPHMVTLTPQNIKHVIQDNVVKTQARQKTTQNEGFATPFIWPVTGTVTGVYGTRRIFNGEKRAPHLGLDIAAPKGTVVRAPAGGVITLAQKGFFFEGGLIFLDHGYGLVSGFLHLEKILVTPGEHVAQGEILGTVGASGRATGPHLDWRLFWFDTALDPRLIIGASDCESTTTARVSHECAPPKRH